MSDSLPAAGAAPVPNPLVAGALASIRTLIAALGRSARLVEERAGVTNAQLFLLRELQAHPGATINELAARAMTSQSTVSVLVTRLEEAGLVARRRGGEDARVVCVSLTHGGEAVARRAAEPPTARLIDALETMPPAELESLSASLDLLLARLDFNARDTTPIFETTTARTAPAPRTPSRPPRHRRRPD